MRDRLIAAMVVLIVGVGTSGCASTVSPSSKGGDQAWAAEWLGLPKTPSDAARVRVAVVDGGVVEHPDISDNVVAEWESDRLVGELRGPHATEMAGLILGINQPDSFLVPERVELLDVRALGKDGRGHPAEIAEGIQWAVDNDADVISMSLSIATDHPELRAAVAEAHEAGAVVVASTANGVDESPAYPAEYPGVVGVTGVSRDFSRAPLAGVRGADIAAPGHDVLVPSVDGHFRSRSGTSVATAMATSTLALCDGMRGLDETAIAQYAHDSGVTVTPDQHNIPVLRCLSGEVVE